MDPISFVVMLAIDAAISYGISYLFPAEGPRLRDLTISASTYGAAIPNIYGQARAAGNLIWASPIIEHKKKKSSGKGGGSYNSYTYTCTFAFAFARGPVTDVLRLWADGKVIYDKTGKSPKVKNTKYQFQVYTGEEDQTPDPRIELLDGVGNGPAYRGLCYIVFYDFLLTDFGNRIPQFAAELVVSNSGGAVFNPLLSRDNPADPLGLLEWGLQPVSGGNTGTSSLPRIDFSRGLWYLPAIHGEATTSDSLSTPLDYTFPDSGITRISITTRTQDKNIYNPDMNLPSYHDFGWHIDPMVGSPGFGHYAGYVQALAAIGKDGSLFVWGTYAGVANTYYPHINTAQLFKLDPYTYQPTAVFGTYTTFSDPDGITTQTPSAAEGIITLDGKRLLIFGGGGAPAEGGYITIFRTANLSFDTLLTKTVHDGLQLACPLNVGNFCIVQRALDSSAISFYTDEDGATTPFHVDTGSGGGNLVPLFAVWDQSDPGIVFGYLDGMVGIFIAKYSTISHTVRWRRNLLGANIPAALSGNSTVNGTLGYVAASETGASTGYLLDTTSGTFRNPNVTVDFRFKVPKDLFLGVDYFSYNLSNGYYTPVAATTVGFPVSIGDADISAQRWDDGTSAVYLGARDAESTSPLADKSNFGIVHFSGAGTTTLGAIVGNLLLQGGLRIGDFDVDPLNAVPVFGYGYANSSDIKGILSELRQVYLFDLFESDFILKSRIRGDPIPDQEINALALGSSSPEVKDDWKQTRVQEADLPAEITLAYMNKDRDYQASTAVYRRPSSPIPTMYSQQQAAIEVNIVASATDAQNLVRKMVYTQWTERTKHDTKLPWAYAYLDPSDLLSVNFPDGRNYFERIESMELGADYSIGTETFSQDASQYTVNTRLVSSGGDGGGSAIVAYPAPAVAFVVNLPLLRDSDDTGGGSSRYYTAIGNDTGNQPTVFGGASLFRSTDLVNFDALYATISDVEWGKVGIATPPPPRGPAGVDWETQIIIHPGVATLSLTSIDDSELWFGANAIIVGDEVIQFRDAIQNANGTWTVSYLLRGRRGTEWACGTHTANEFVIAPDALTFVPQVESISSAGQARGFKAVTPSTTLNDAIEVDITYIPRDLMPYTVSDIRRTLGTDVGISWARRTRFGGGMLDGTGVVPLHETTEAYELYILAAPFAGDLSLPDAPSVFRRKVSLTAPSFTYTAAMQTADSFTHATDTLHLVIYQISGVVGRGFPSPRDITPGQTY